MRLKSFTDEQHTAFRNFEMRAEYTPYQWYFKLCKLIRLTFLLQQLTQTQDK